MMGYLKMPDKTAEAIDDEVDRELSIATRRPSTGFSFIMLVVAS